MSDIKCDKCDQRAVHHCGVAPNQTFYCDDHMPGWNELGETLRLAAAAELGDPRNNPDDAYAAFMSMPQSEWQGLLVSLLGGGVLTPAEQIGFERALIGPDSRDSRDRS